MARLGIKNGHQRAMCYIQDGLCAQNIDTILRQIFLIQSLILISHLLLSGMWFACLQKWIPKDMCLKEIGLCAQIS